MNKIKNTYTKDLYKPLDTFKNNYNIVYHTIDTNNLSLRELVIVDKNKKGFYRIDNGYFGKSEDIDSLAKKLNEDKGYNEKQALDIIITSY